MSDMADGNDDEKQLKELGCGMLANDADARVVILKGPKKDFDSLEIKHQARFIGIMKGWCNGQKLLPAMFNYNEGRSKQKNCLIQVFKGFKHRFYGFQTKINNTKTFVVVKSDLNKKQDKADPIILARAMEISDQLQAAIDAASEGK
ncbi:hypothetical protein N6H05_00215 [Sphingobium sp. WTD-1]|uniref:hypothetical protein n=1 Tax=Sphingobium sp. WTD-1 TaxID=2979467 RepID=UPI0024DECD22|nr:hypothetical protein [Sphingobium sp. WTD-1]WIA56296.1 hypothetical protein N6H05_00215 [Sphingobium sp. WTD-1]